MRYASAQVVHYSFDMCDGNDEVLLQSDADLQGVTCGCGLVDTIVTPVNKNDSSSNVGVKFTGIMFSSMVENAFSVLQY